MKYRNILYGIFLFFLTAATAPAQLYEMNDNRYVTESKRLETTLAPGEKVNIMSVSSLSGKLYIHT
ncbi:MAG: hypothetical protein AB1746_12565, partial [Candidatus Zixiibacteriota bacterium]